MPIKSRNIILGGQQLRVRFLWCSSLSLLVILCCYHLMFHPRQGTSRWLQVVGSTHQPTNHITCPPQGLPIAFRTAGWAEACGMGLVWWCRTWPFLSWLTSWLVVDKRGIMVEKLMINGGRYQVHWMIWSWLINNSWLMVKKLCQSAAGYEPTNKLVSKHPLDWLGHLGEVKSQGCRVLTHSHVYYMLHCGGTSCTGIPCTDIFATISTALLLRFVWNQSKIHRWMCRVYILGDCSWALTIP